MEKEILKNIQYQLDKIIEKEKPAWAAFDADGTLWPSDVGKNFFQYQVEKDLFKGRGFQPYSEFNRIQAEKGKKQALLWLAQMQSGFSLEQLNQWVGDFLQARPVKIFLFQKHLIKWLMDRNVQVVIVSSSLKWVLDQALKEYGISKGNIIGVQTLVEKGIITDQLILPAPIHEDKVPAFQRKTGGAAPLFVAGNTLSDQALLELSTHARLVLATARPGDRNYESEKKLLSLARERNWFYQQGLPELA